MKASIFLICALYSLTVFATPNNAIWENEILIGVNSDNYYTIRTCKYLTGTYYHDIDSIFLIEKELSSGAIIDKIVLRVIDHKDSTANGDWQHKELIENPINLIEYQKNKHMEIAYQGNYFDSKFDFLRDGLFINYRNGKELIVDKTYLDKYIDWYSEYIQYQEEYSDDIDFRIKVALAYETRTHMFLVVESGSDHCDMDFRQSILVIDKNKYRTAKQNIVKRKN